VSYDIGGPSTHIKYRRHAAESMGLMSCILDVKDDKVGRREVCFNISATENSHFCA